MVVGLSALHRVFFFQAEDGIRDHCVTGVQTCALPISWTSSPTSSTRGRRCFSATSPSDTPCTSSRSGYERSEERRVGKECRDRWAADPEKKTEAVTRAAEHICVTPGTLSSGDKVMAEG